MPKSKVGEFLFASLGLNSLLAEYVSKYASKDAADEAGAESESEDDMSSVGSFGDDDDQEPAGQMEEV